MSRISRVRLFLLLLCRPILRWKSLWFLVVVATIGAGLVLRIPFRPVCPHVHYPNILFARVSKILGYQSWVSFLPQVLDAFTDYIGCSNAFFGGRGQ